MPQWLEASKKAGSWQDSGPHLLQDPKAEAAFGFSLASALAAAQAQPLLTDLQVLLTPGDAWLLLCAAACGMLASLPRALPDLTGPCSFPSLAQQLRSWRLPLAKELAGSAVPVESASQAASAFSNECHGCMQPT